MVTMQTHVISIIAISVSLIGVNLIEFWFDTTIKGGDLWSIVLQNVVFGIGMYYYAAKVKLDKTGLSEDTTPIVDSSTK